MRSISEIKKEAKTKIKEFMWPILLATLVYGAVLGLLEKVPNLLGLNVATTETTTKEIFGVAVEVTTSSPTTMGHVWNAFMFIVTGFISYAFTMYILKLLRKEKISFNDVITSIKNRWEAILVSSIVYGIIVALGTVLLVVPGIIAILGLSFYDYILIDNENMTGIDTLKTSWNMMKGHKGNYLAFGLSFILWILLCIFVLPLIYVIPFVMISNYIYYEELKKSSSQN